MKLYFDNKDGPKSHFLHPAQFYFTSEHMVIKTVLGSCVAVTMFSPETGHAAICHAVLPSCRDCSCPPGVCLNKYKFVQCAIPEMLSQFNQEGVRPHQIEIKMFGGADLLLLSKDSFVSDNQRVGRKNILKAREIISDNDLSLKGGDVGGTLGRKVQFDTATGDVWLKRLNRKAISKE